jgi:anti-anti-sigma regulatory factor
MASNPQFTLTLFPAGGGQLKVTGCLNVQHSIAFKQQLTTLLTTGGNFFLSFRDVDEMDISALQMLWSLRKEFISTGRRLTISWPQKESQQQLLGKTGLLQVMQK